MKTKNETKLLEEIYDKLRSDCQDPQMGLGESYFEELILFAYSYTKPKTNRKVFKSQDIKKEVENGKH